MNVETAVDQEARDLIREIGAMIRQHIAVCEERENRRVRVENEKDKRLDQFLSGLGEKVAAIQKGYDSAYHDISGRLNNDVNTLASSIQLIDKKVGDANKLYGSRFWTLAVAMIMGLIAALWGIVTRRIGLN